MALSWTAEHRATVAKMREILDKADRENRDMTPDEQKRWDDLEKHANKTQDRMYAIVEGAEMARRDAEAAMPAVADDWSGGTTTSTTTSTPPTERWIDENGHEVRMVRRGQRFADLPVRNASGHSGLHVGKLVR